MFGKVLDGLDQVRERATRAKDALNETVVQAEEAGKKTTQILGDIEGALDGTAKNFEDRIDGLAVGAGQKVRETAGQAISDLDTDQLSEQLQQKLEDGLVVDTSRVQRRLAQQIGGLAEDLLAGVDGIGSALDAKFEEIADGLSADIQTGFVTTGGPGIVGS